MTLVVNFLVFGLVVHFYFNNIDVNLEYFFIPFFFLVLFHYIKILTKGIQGLVSKKNKSIIKPKLLVIF